MATRTIANGGGNWDATGTWVEGVVPTSADNVVATATSGSLTINVAASCRQLDLTGYTATLTHNAGVTVSIGDATAGASSRALLFPGSGWTYVLGDPVTSAYAFVSTSATQQTVSFSAANHPGNVTFDGVGGSWKLTTSMITAASATITLTNGSLDTNGLACSWGSLSSTNSNTRTLTLGASAITLTLSSGTVWDTTTSTGLTFNANTSSITITAPAGGTGNTATMNAGSLTYNSVSFAPTSSNQLLALNGSSPTFANFTITGPNTTNAIFTLGTSFTVTTALTINGNSSNINRLLVNSTVVGTQQTITNNGTATFSNLDLQDINGAGSTSWDIHGISGGAGDCLGNANITFTSPRTLFWVGNTASWSGASKWATTSGGSGVGVTSPLAQDSLVFDSHSFSATGQTVTINMPRAGKDIDFTNVTNSPTLTGNFAAATLTRIYGSLTLVAGMSCTVAGAFWFEGRGSNTFTTANLSLICGIVVNAPGGSLTLSGNFITITTSNAGCRAGTLTATGNVTAGTFQMSANSSPGVAKTINMGSGTWTAIGTGTVWNTAGPITLTINAQTSTIVVSDTSATSKTFAGNVFTYNVLTITGDNVTMTGNSTFATLNVNNAGLTNGLKLTNGVTQTITSAFTTNGSAGNLAILASSLGGSAATISKASGTVSVDYMSIKDSHATGGAAWYAGANSTGATGQNNTGWIFTAPPSGNEFLAFM